MHLQFQPLEIDLKYLTPNSRRKGLYTKEVYHLPLKNYKGVSYSSGVETSSTSLPSLSSDSSHRKFKQTRFKLGEPVWNYKGDGYNKKSKRIYSPTSEDTQSYGEMFK